MAVTEDSRPGPSRGPSEVSGFLPGADHSILQAVQKALTQARRIDTKVRKIREEKSTKQWLLREETDREEPVGFLAPARAMLVHK